MMTRGLIKESMKEGLRGKYARTSEESSKPQILLIWYHDPGSFLDQCNAFHKSLWNPIEAQISNEKRKNRLFFCKNLQSIMASGLMFANLFHVLKLAFIVQVLLCSFVLTRPCKVQKQIIGRNLAPWWHFCLYLNVLSKIISWVLFNSYLVSQIANPLFHFHFHYPNI